VAIVNWNTSRAALEAAAAYLASEGVEARVTIVDNASEPDQRRLLEEGRPDRVELRLNAENLGFGAAANGALRNGAGELVVVSNADVLPEPGALAALAGAIEGAPRAGMVGPVFEGPTADYHAALPGGATMLARIFVGSFNRRAARRPAQDEVAEVGQPAGACFAMRRELWGGIGGFDEGFFLWYEDVDLARRLRDSGHRNLIVGSARVRHVGARSFAQVDRRRQQAIRFDSVERYIRKHHPRLGRSLAPPLLALARRLRAGGASGALPPGEEP
jgi:GT2 family glycosyltransferase